MEDSSDYITPLTWKPEVRMKVGTSENNMEKDSGEGKERVGLTSCQKQRVLKRVHCNLIGHRARRG